MKIDPEFREIIRVITSEERKRLTESIQAEGCRDALVVWEEKDILLDGHNRKDICDGLQIAYKVKMISLEDRLAAMIWIRRNQAARRNLTDDQRAANAAQLAALESKKAMQERAKKGGEAGGVGRPKQNSLADASVSKLLKPKERTRKAAAEQAGVSERKVRQAQTVMKDAPQLFKKVESGELQLSAAVRESKRAKIVEHLNDIKTQETKAVQGVYDVIVIDPPWPMEIIERETRPNQVSMPYPTMDLTAIRWLKIPHARDCHIWMWTTQKFLAETLSIFHQRKWRFACVFVWHKPGGFQPIGLPQFNAEFAVYGRVGKATFIDTKAFPVCFNGARGKHSEKPQEFYDMVCRVTAGRRLDMFSRRKIDGFDGWGNQAQE